MVKTRFSSTDVKAMARDAMAAMEGKRVANIYDLSDKCYLIKLVTPGDAEKTFLLLESGVRFHKTKYTRSQPATPSPFTMTLRKHLRTKRLERVDQLGMDRVVDFKFGSGESANHIILELYSSGNIVLTDSNYEVIALLRSHQFSEDVTLKTGEIYPITSATNLVTLQNSASELTKLDDAEAFSNWLDDQSTRMAKEVQQNALVEVDTKQSNKKKKAQVDATKAPYLRQVLLAKSTCVSFLGPDILDHCMVSAGVDSQCRVSQALALEPAQRLVFLDTLKAAVTTVLAQLDIPGPGYVMTGPPVSAIDPEDAFVDYTPMLFKQHADKPHRTFDSFAEAVDEYYTRIEVQRLQKEQQSRVLQAEKKLAKVQQDQKRMVDSLVQHQRHLQNCAMLLETHADEVDKVRLVINSAIAADMAWPDVEAMVESEQKKGNPLALRISKMELEGGKIFLRYDAREVHGDFDSSDEEEEEATAGQVIVEIDLSMTSRANAAKLYCNKKATQVKEAKTAQAATKVLKAAEEQTRKTVAAAQSGAVIKAVRKAHWFEKFHWFVTSEGFLVVAGRDLQQSDQIYRKFMSKEDAYVHADIRGALPAFVFARKSADVSEGSSDDSEKRQLRVTPLALQEAAMLVVCKSSAWGAKVLTSAYWVKAEQVSKKGPNGAPLVAGTFAIFGKKNFLPPMPLEMGFGIMFRMDADSAKRHVNDRKMREYDFELESLSSQVLDRFEKYSITFDGEEDGEEALGAINEGEEEEEGVAQGDAEDETGAGEDPVAAVANEGTDGSDSEADADDEETDARKEDDKPESEAEAETSGSSSEEERRNAKSKGGSKNCMKKGGTKQAPAPAAGPATVGGRKKKVDRKKARRYAEQDEEDVELAMMVLGHASKKSGKTLSAMNEEKEAQKKKTELKARQSKAGVTVLKGDWAQLLDMLCPEVRDALEQLVGTGKVKAGGIDADVMKDLALFPVEQALHVLSEFRDSKNLAKTSNKSALMLGIMRTVRKIMDQSKVVASSSAKPSDETGAEAAETLGEDEDDDLDGSPHDTTEIDLLTECPTQQDKLLYALPVCAPYMSMQRFKFKVKLTPGTLKKGKAAKQAMELLPRVKDCCDAERSLMKNLADSEIFGAFMGDVKLAAPGLHQQLRHKKQRGQK